MSEVSSTHINSRIVQYTIITHTSIAHDFVVINKRE